MKRVLLIEPQFYTRVDIEDILSPHGYQVASVKDRYSALMKMKSQIFHLILTALKNDPAELFFLLKSLRETGATLPVVILATNPTTSIIQRLSKYQPIEVIVQPFSIKHLANRIDHITERCK